MTTVIHFYAGPGAGKSTIAAELFVLMKKSARFGSVELVQEYAKELVWQERFDELSVQMNVTNGQIGKIIPLTGKVDYLISDSPLPIGLIYATKEEYDEVSRVVSENMKKFDRIINIFVERGESRYETIGRIHSENEALEIDAMILKLFKDFTMPYHTISRDGVADVLNLL